MKNYNNVYIIFYLNINNSFVLFLLRLFKRELIFGTLKEYCSEVGYRNYQGVEPTSCEQIIICNIQLKILQCIFVLSYIALIGCYGVAHT